MCAMITTIWNLLPTNIKWGMGIGVLALILLVGGVFSFQSNKISSLETKLIECQVGRANDKLIYDDEREKAKTTIDNQNREISQFKLDEKTYKVTIKQKEDELNKLQIESQVNIATELAKDSSDTNQLNITKRLLKEFSNEKY